MDLQEIGVTEKKKKYFERKGVNSVEDLLYFFPRKYVDLTKLGLQQPGEISTVIGILKGVSRGCASSGTPFTRASMQLFGKMELYVYWFNQPYMAEKIASLVGKQVLVCGKVSSKRVVGKISIPSPLVFCECTSVPPVYPIYRKCDGISTEYLQKTMDAALAKRELLTDPMQPEDIAMYQIMSRADALRALHHPMSMQQIEEAQKRIAFDFLKNFHLGREKSENLMSKTSPYRVSSFALMQRVQKAFGYDLTEDQRSVTSQLYCKMQNGNRLDAIVQGDVGTGKSIIAYLCMALMAGSGFQAVLLAPTKSLALQHFNSLSRLLDGTGEQVRLVDTMPTRKAEKAALLEDAESGSVKFFVGTHGILSEQLHFLNLAMVICDEEQKFGVVQRNSLLVRYPCAHFISMTATPIPRTLALGYYADKLLLDVHTMPAGRSPVRTAATNNRERIFTHIRNQIDSGHQIYVVSPLVDKDADTVEKWEKVVSTTELKTLYQQNLPTARIAVLTGKTLKREMSQILEDFRAGRIDILVATTVIEVGIDVPNATTIVIENAERFGLATLHQLRGRVGRGSAQGYCILRSADNENERLRVMTQTTNGFEIAKADLQQRGAGDFLGIRQSGDCKELSLMLAYPDIDRKAKDYAERLSCEIAKVTA